MYLSWCFFWLRHGLYTEIRPILHYFQTGLALILAWCYCKMIYFMRRYLGVKSVEFDHYKRNVYDFRIRLI